MGPVIALALMGGVVGLADPDRLSPGGPQTAAEAAGPVSPAERIARLQRSLEMDRNYLESLNARLQDPAGEYHRAEARFKQLDGQLGEAREAARQLKDAGQTTEAAAREAAVRDLETHWQLARRRFDMAIQERKTLQATTAALARKIQEDQQALDKLTGLSAPAAPVPPGRKDRPTPEGPATAKAGSTAPAPLPPGLQAPRLVPPAAPAQQGSAEAPEADNVPPELVRARAEAKTRERAVQKAEDQVRSVAERLEALRTNIKLARKLLDTARERADQAQQFKSALDAELQKKIAAKAPEEELKALSGRLQKSERWLQEALAEVRSTTDRLHDLQAELTDLQAEQLAAQHEADDKKRAAQAAAERVSELQNPFRLQNVLQWLLRHGPRLLFIVGAMLVLHRLARVVSRRIVRAIARDGAGKRGNRQDRENRAQTLVGVFSNTASLLILGGGALMALDEMSIPVVPLMGGAAVLGLAVAFGAQNLIKDYFSGFMVLMEDQYGINDVVRIGSISGQVERVSLRATVLRDLEGVVHFVPHGTITTVSNMTHGWSRALFAISIAYEEDVDRVMGVLLGLGHEIRQDPAFGPLILDDPEMLGVDDLADSSVVIKFFLKTRPLQQWPVKRELLRRIKKRFDELGIDTPSHHTAHPRQENGPAAPTAEEGPGPSRSKPAA